MARVAMQVGHRRRAAEEVATDSTNTLFTGKKCTLVPAHEPNFIYQPSLNDLVYLIAGFQVMVLFFQANQKTDW